MSIIPEDTSTQAPSTSSSLDKDQTTNETSESGLGLSSDGLDNGLSSNASGRVLRSSSVTYTYASELKKLLSDFSHTEGHHDFIKMVLHAKSIADTRGLVVPVKWRDYTTLIEPNMAPFTKADLITRLSNAIKKKVCGPEENECPSNTSSFTITTPLTSAATPSDKETCDLGVGDQESSTGATVTTSTKPPSVAQKKLISENFVENEFTAPGFFSPVAKSTQLTTNKSLTPGAAEVNLINANQSSDSASKPTMPAAAKKPFSPVAAASSPNTAADPTLHAVADEVTQPGAAADPNLHAVADEVTHPGAASELAQPQPRAASEPSTQPQPRAASEPSTSAAANSSSSHAAPSTSAAANSSSSHAAPELAQPRALSEPSTSTAAKSSSSSAQEMIALSGGQTPTESMILKTQRDIENLEFQLQSNVSIDLYF